VYATTEEATPTAPLRDHQYPALAQETKDPTMTPDEPADVIDEGLQGCQAAWWLAR
jgi:hypothetical protein